MFFGRTCLHYGFRAQVATRSQIIIVVIIQRVIRILWVSILTQILSNALFALFLLFAAFWLLFLEGYQLRLKYHLHLGVGLHLHQTYTAYLILMVSILLMSKHSHLCHSTLTTHHRYLNLTSEVEAGCGPRDDTHGQGLEGLICSLRTDNLLQDLLSEPGTRVLLHHRRL